MENSTILIQSIGKKLINNKFEEILPENALLKIKFIGLLFTGSWCPPCREFQKELISIYKEANSKEKNFEIIQISNEQNEKEFNESINENIPWLFLPFDDYTIMNLVNEYKITYLPVLIIINKDKVILTETGRKDVSLLKNKACDEWYRLYREQKERETERALLIEH